MAARGFAVTPLPLPHSGAHWGHLVMGIASQGMAPTQDVAARGMAPTGRTAGAMKLLFVKVGLHPPPWWHGWHTARWQRTASPAGGNLRLVCAGWRSHMCRCGALASYCYPKGSKLVQT